MNISVIVNDVAQPGFVAEHGLSLWIETQAEVILLDTGQGGALIPNGERAGVNFSKISKLIFSHGHYDHTGGFDTLLKSIPDNSRPDLYFGPGLVRPRYRQAEGEQPREIGIPAACRDALQQYPANRKHQIEGFTQISDELFLTGPIPRQSGEDTGGCFSLDPNNQTPDWITDEIALLFTDGTLIVGCCHAGIINTVQYCRQNCPEIKIKKIIGGLHLLHATSARRDQTAAFLESMNLEDLQLLHCTGDFCMEHEK